MTENKNDQPLSDLISPNTKREDFVKRVEEILEPDEVINIHPMRKDAADKLVESLSYLGVIAAQPATFDIDAFKFIAGSEFDDEAAYTAWYFLKRTGILVDESKAGEGRVSIEQKTIDMLINPSNGFLTFDED